MTSKSDQDTKAKSNVAPTTHDPAHPAQHTAVGRGPDTSADDATRARSEDAFNAAKATGDANAQRARDLQGTPADDASRRVIEALQGLSNDSERRRVLREAAQSCAIDITTLSADPSVPGAGTPSAPSTR